MKRVLIGYFKDFKSRIKLNFRESVISIGLRIIVG